MNLWTMITVVAVCGIMSGVISSYLKHRAYALKNSRNNPEIDNKIRALEDRIRVLEEIVTDKSYQLKSRIDEL